MSALCFKALEVNQLLSDKLFYSRYLINYDATTKRFTSESSINKLWPFYFTWLFVIFFIGNLTIVYIVIYMGVFHPDTISSDRLFFGVLLSAPGLLSNGLNYGLMQNSEEIRIFKNLLLDLKDKRMPSAPVKGKEKGLLAMLQKEYLKFLDKSKWQDIDFVGLLMIHLSIFLGLFPIVWIPAALFVRGDPMTYLAWRLTDYEKFSWWVQIPFRVLPSLCSICYCMEAARTVRTIFLMLLLVVKVTADLLQQIETIAKYDVSAAMERYSEMYAVHAKSLRPAAIILFAAVEGGIFIAIFSLTGTFVGWRILSPFIYWLNPLMAIFALTIMAIALPCAAYTAQLSMSLVNDWHFRIDECIQGSHRLNARVLKKFQPMAFYMNGLGYILGETKMRVFETVVMNTVDAVLMCMDYVK